MPSYALYVSIDQVQPNAAAGVVGVKPLVELEDAGPGPFLLKARAVIGMVDENDPAGRDVVDNCTWVLAFT